MVRHEYTLLGFTWGIDIEQDSATGEFQITFDNDARGNAVNTVGDAQYIQIEPTDILNEDFNPRDNIETRDINAHRVGNVQRVDLTMLKESVFESWAILVSPAFGTFAARWDSLWLIFDIFRHQLILRNQPLIEFHGFLNSSGTTESRNSIVAHANTYHNTLSRFREGDVLDPTGGDTMVDTGVGFCKPPTIENNQIKFCLLAPPSRHRLRSDHLQWSNIKGDKQPEGCLLYTSPSPRDS